jgi:hypothetical protein
MMPLNGVHGNANTGAIGQHNFPKSSGSPATADRPHAVDFGIYTHFHSENTLNE